MLSPGGPDGLKISHNHPEGIQGARAHGPGRVPGAHGERERDDQGHALQRHSVYDMNRTVDDIRPAYSFDVSCQGSVPRSHLSPFLDSNSYEDAVRNAVSLGGDSDTQACIAGGIAEAFYGGVPETHPGKG